MRKAVGSSLSAATTNSWPALTARTRLREATVRSPSSTTSGIRSMSKLTPKPKMSNITTGMARAM